jgi:hypothetical protein
MAGKITSTGIPDAPTVPYGYEDPEEVLRQRAYEVRRDQLASIGDDPDAYTWEQFERDWADTTPTMGGQTWRQNFLRGVGWTEEDIANAQAAYAARQRALALDGGMAPELAGARERYLQNRALQAGVLGNLEQRAAMPGTSASQWASQAGMNQLMNQVAARAAGDPRMGMRALASGGGQLAQQAAVSQGNEGLARQGVLLNQAATVRKADLAQAAREQQLLADDLAWQQAKEQAGQRWADVALRQRGVKLGLDADLRAALAGAQGGIDWKDVTSGILGASAAGLGAYASMNPGK